jgi:molybdopterin converting factor small subunit
MIQVTIELWLWLGNELKGDFECPSEMRCARVENADDGTTIRNLLGDLAKRYFPIAKSVFDIETEELFPDVVMNYNDRVISPNQVYDRTLKNGDRITLLPLAGGG